MKENETRFSQNEDGTLSIYGLKPGAEYELNFTNNRQTVKIREVPTEFYDCHACNGIGRFNNGDPCMLCDTTGKSEIEKPRQAVMHCQACNGINIQHRLENIPEDADTKIITYKGDIFKKDTREVMHSSSDMWRVCEGKPKYKMLEAMVKQQAQLLKDIDHMLNEFGDIQANSPVQREIKRVLTYPPMQKFYTQQHGRAKRPELGEENNG